MPTASARLLAAVAVLATAAVVGAPSATGASTTGHRASAPVHVDDGAARTNPVDPALVPGGLDAAGHGRHVPLGAKTVAALRSDGSSGFLPFEQRSYAFGAYRFQLVSSGADGDVELVRPAVEQVAAELTAVTHITFSVDPGQVPRPTSVERFPTGWCGAFDGHQCSLFDDRDDSVGVIRVGFAAGSPCRMLAPRGVRTGAVGCAGPESGRDAAGNVHHVRGNVWLSPSLNDVNLPIAADVIAHETAHAFGLDHYQRTYTAVPGATPVRQLMYPSLHDDPSDTSGRYRSGDRNGLWWLQPDEAWYVAATYRDFLGRIPDTDGYRYWANSDATIAEYVDALAASDEWVGHVVSGFYLDVFDRAPDPGGLAYWSARVRDQGVPLVAAQLYGSDEYLRRQGGTTAGFVRGLYRDLLGRDAAADPAGLAFWVAEAQRRGRPAVALALFQSREMRGARVRDLYCTLLDRPPDPAGQAFWADVILTAGDLALARNLATSDEYLARAPEFTLLPLGTPPAPPGC